MVRRTWMIAVVVLVLLASGSALLAQEVVQAAPPVKQVDARSLVPEGAVLYLEVDDLPGTWQAIKEGPLYQELIQAQFGKQLRVMAAAPLAQMEVILGVSVEDAVTKMLGQRMVLALWEPGSNEGALIVELADPDGVRGMIDAMLHMGADPSGESPFEETTYRSHVIYSSVSDVGARRANHFALCGNVLIVAGNLSHVQFLIDRFEDAPTSSILSDEGFKSARASLPAGCRAMAFIDLEKALADVPLDEETLKATGAKPVLEQFAVKHALSLVRSLRRAAAGIYLTSSAVEVQLNVTRDPSVLTDEVRAIFAQENVTPKALAYRTEDTVLFVSLPRITAQMELIGQALELALPAAGPPPAGATNMQPVQPLDLILGHNFTREVLPGIGPEISLLVEANPAVPALGEHVRPGMVLSVPGLAALSMRAALFVQLSQDIKPEVERVVEAALGVLLTMARGNCQLSRIQIGEVTGYTIDFMLSRPEALRRVLRPTIAFTDRFLVVGSTPEMLQRLLARKPGATATGGPAPVLPALSGQIVLYADLRRFVEGLGAALRQMAAPETTPEEAAEGGEPGPATAPTGRIPPGIGAMLEFIRPLAGQLTLTVQHTPAETNANLSLRTATPLLP